MAVHSIRLTTLLLITLFSINNLSAQIGQLALSPNQTLKQSIAKTDITIEYSRPAIRGRIIFGDLVPYGKLWRTGANRNTKITFSEKVMMGDSIVSPGTYALLTIPEKDSWTVYLYNETHHWEAPSDFSMEKVVAQAEVKPQTLDHVVHSLTIMPENMTNDGFDLSVSWEKTKVFIPINLTTEEAMSKLIDNVLSGPDATDYYHAARYRLQSGREIDQALLWIDKAIDMTGEAKWWQLNIKADCHIELRQTNKAKEVIAQGKAMTKDSEFAYGYFERLEKKLNRL